MFSNLFAAKQQQQPTQPAQPAQPEGQQQKQEVNPLDAFSKLWETPQASAKQEDIFKLNAEDLDKAVSGFNFTQEANFNELSKKALEGDPAALSTLLNSTGQKITKTIFTMMPHIIQAAVDKRVNALDSALPGKIKEIQASDSLRSDDARFNHPAVAPMFQAIQKQFMVANPDASAADINKMVKDYMVNMSAIVAPSSGGAQKQEQTQESKNFDFSAFEFT